MSGHVGTAWPDPLADWVERALAGKSVDFETRPGDLADILATSVPPPERIVAAEDIRRLCLGLFPGAEVLPPRGIELRGAAVVGTLDLDGAELRVPLYFERCVFEAAPNFIEARTRTLGFPGCRLPGLRAEGLICEGSILLHGGLRVEGELLLAGARVKGRIDLSGSVLGTHPELRSVDATALEVDWTLDLRRCRALGPVHLRGARIGGDCLLDDVELAASGAFALEADHIHVRGALYLRGEPPTVATVKGGVSLQRASVGGNLAVEHCHLIARAGEVAWRSEGATVAGAFIWRNHHSSPDGHVYWSTMRVSVLSDDSKSWPAQGRLSLVGLVYDLVDPDATLNVRDRLDWLSRQPAFYSQPYEHLVTVLRKTGNERDARTVAIAKQHQLLTQGSLPLPTRLGMRVLGLVIGYGYKPWQSLWLMLAVVLIGWAVFTKALEVGEVVATRPVVPMPDATVCNSTYPCFTAFMYSLDLFVPVISFGQAAHWRMGAGVGFAVYASFHVALGWLITTLAIAGITGLVRK